MNKSILKKIIKEEAQKLVKEIGEASGKKYSWDQLESGDLSKSGGSQSYDFWSESGVKYIVTLTHENEFIEIDFLADRNYDTTNRGELYSVMATIVDIIKFAIKDLTKGSSGEEDIRGLKYVPVGKGSDLLGTQRDQLYRAYIEKALPGVEIINLRGNTFVVFP